MTIDDWKSFVFSNNNNTELISKETDKLEQEMYHLFDIYGNNTNKNGLKYFAYKLSNNGEFGLILYDSKDRNECYIPAHEILETLKEEISMKCLFTVSIGCSRLIEDDLGFSDEWYERIKKHLFTAQKSGKNEICFGTSRNNNNIDDEDKTVDVVISDHQSDKIENQSLHVIKKYGFAAAVDLKTVQIYANNGPLVNENYIKLDVIDPTKSLAINLQLTTEVTFKQIHLEVVKFINDNNNNNQKFLEYPKLYLNSNRSKCTETEKCQQCYHNNGNQNSKNYKSNITMFCLCSTKRREIANRLFHIALQQHCDSASLSTIIKQLFVPDNLLLKDNDGYKLKSNWFVNVYSFLQWQYEVVNVLLHNLAESNMTEMAENVFLFKFDLLTSLHSYLERLIEYLVLYYTCFDDELWIAVFYPFIEAGIGTYDCKMLFAESKQHQADVTSICSIALDENTSTQQQLDNKERCVEETKGISIFTRILCNIYETGDISIDQDKDIIAAGTITCNPFDLSHKIYLKLNETVNNIKTQLLIQQMTGKDPYVLDVSKQRISMMETFKDGVEVGNDDMNIDSNKSKIQAPSFIRLFVIKRIIGKYISSDISHGHSTSKTKVETKIQKLANGFEHDPEITKIVFDIVMRLITDGIKKFMEKWYNEKEQADIIEMIFNDTILIKFETEYNQLITYVENGKDNKNQMIVFNSSDLMCYIFQYFDHGIKFDGDLISCSLVNTCWMYHVWNINSIYYVNLTELIRNTLKHNDHDDKDNNACGSSILRIWQRIIKAKAIDVRFYPTMVCNKIILDKLSMLRNIDILNVSFSHYDEIAHLDILKMLLMRSAKIAKVCNVKVNQRKPYKENALQALRLINTRCVTIGDVYFYRLWTNKCHTLVLDYVKNIGKKWCNFVIQNCDCSNIKELELVITFDANSIDKLILEQLAFKFASIQSLKISIKTNIDKNVFLFCQLLQPTIIKNNGKVELDIPRFAPDQYILMNKIVIERQLKIDTLSVYWGFRDGEDPNSAVKFIQERDNNELNHLKIGAWGKAIHMLNTKLMNQLLFRSINVLQVDGQISVDLKDVNDFLGIEMIVDKKLFVIATFSVNYTKQDADKFSSLFDTLCANISNLIGKRIEIDIKITITSAYDKLFDKCLTIYSSCFECDTFLNAYQKPNCLSGLCKPLNKAYVCFGINENNSFVLHTRNVEYTWKSLR